MAIQLETIPNHNIEPLLTHLKEYLSVPKTPEQMRVFLVDGADEGETSVCQFHAKTYSVTIDNIRKGDLVSSAKCTGSILLGICGEYIIQELTICENNKVVSQNKTDSHLGKKIMAAVKIGRELPETQKNDYKIKIVTIPSLHVFILWLHPVEDHKKGVEDLFIPITDYYGGLETSKSYKKEELLKFLKGEAEKLASKWDREYV